MGPAYCSNNFEEGFRLLFSPHVIRRYAQARKPQDQAGSTCALIHTGLLALRGRRLARKATAVNIRAQPIEVPRRCHAPIQPSIRLRVIIHSKICGTKHARNQLTMFRPARFGVLQDEFQWDEPKAGNLKVRTVAHQRQRA